VTISAQDWERDWWGNCANTYGEEAKQIAYARRMGLDAIYVGGHWPSYDIGGRSVIDIGGGPVSMLLKCVNRGDCTVVDPCGYPQWVADRYSHVGIRYEKVEAEEFHDGDTRDEAWLYNVLQHVVDPEKACATANRLSHRIRMFEWIETETNEGHPHSLHADELNRWLGTVGEIGYVNENGAVGLAYWVVT
jgi:hypothetical protein